MRFVTRVSFNFPLSRVQNGLGRARVQLKKCTLLNRPKGKLSH